MDQRRLPPFVAPEPLFIPGRLSLTSTENTNTFGFWESPLLAFCRSPQNLDPNQIILPYDYDGDPCYLFRSIFNLSSDTSDSLRVPIIRYRSSSESFEQSDVLVATSVGSSDYSPVLGGRWYTHYFTIPPNQSGFRLDFDLMNMDPKDSPNAVVSIEQFEVEGVDWEALGAPRFEKKYSFIMDSLDWTPRTAATMKEPLFEVNTFGLQIRGVASGSSESPNSIIFGYWSSLETAADGVKLEGNRLYRATFRVASDAAPSQRVCVPAFRVRLNDSSMRSCAYVNIESRYDDSRVPAGGKFESYYVYFYVPPQLAGGNLILSLDYLYVPGGQNDPKIAIRMPWVEIESFALPGATP